MTAGRSPRRERPRLVHSGADAVDGDREGVARARSAPAPRMRR